MIAPEGPAPSRFCLLHGLLFLLACRCLSTVDAAACLCWWGKRGRAPAGPPAPFIPCWSMVCLLYGAGTINRLSWCFLDVQTRWAFCFWSHMKRNLCWVLVYSRRWPFVCKQTTQNEMKWQTSLVSLARDPRTPPGKMFLLQILLHFWTTQPLFCKLASSCVWFVALSSLLPPSHTSLFPHKPHYLWMWWMALIIDYVYFLKIWIQNASRPVTAESAPVR